MRFPILRVRGANYVATLLGAHGMTVSRLCERSGAKIWLQPCSSTTPNMYIVQIGADTAQQAKSAKQAVLAICQSITAMENMDLLPELYNEWLYKPSLAKCKSRTDSTNMLTHSVPARLANQVRGLEALFAKSKTVRFSVSSHPARAFQDRPSPLLCNIDAKAMDAELIKLVRHFVFNEFFFALHAGMRQVSNEDFDLLTRHSVNARSADTTRFADGNTPFLTPRSKTIRVPSEFVTLNKYGLSDFFIQLERKTGVAITFGESDILPGQRDVCLLGDASVISLAAVPFLDQVDDFTEKFDAWRTQVRRGYLYQFGLEDAEVEAFLNEPFTPRIPNEDLVELMRDEEFDVYFNDLLRRRGDDDESYRTLPTRERVEMTRRELARELQWGGGAGGGEDQAAAASKLSWDAVTPHEIATVLSPRTARMLAFAKLMETPRLAHRLMEAVEKGRNVPWIRARGEWNRRFHSLLLRLERQCTRRVLAGSVYVDTMQYLDDFTKLVREKALIFPKQVLQDYVDEDELEDLHLGERFPINPADGEDDEDGIDSSKYGRHFVAVQTENKRQI